LRFVHCTNSLDAVIGIMNHGFIVNPCQRKTLGYFTNRDEFVVREPQYFGMTCLHGFKYLPNYKYWGQYGPFGLEMNPKWVVENGFHNVNYIKPCGLKFRRLKIKFDYALAELDAVIDSEFPDDAFRQMAYTNKNIAGVLGAKKWVEFLAEFEYMEKYKNSFEQEWRYVRKEPLYNCDSIPVIIDNLNNNRGWSKHIHTFKFSPKDLVRIHMEEADKERFREVLPSGYSGIEVQTTINQAFQRMQSLKRLLH
jgi:hypothetical protein